MPFDIIALPLRRKRLESVKMVMVVLMVGANAREVSVAVRGSHAAAYATFDRVLDARDGVLHLVHHERHDGLGLWGDDLSKWMWGEMSCHNGASNRKKVKTSSSRL